VGPLTGVRSLFITGAGGLVGRALLDRLDPDRFNRVSLLTRSTLRLPKRIAENGRVHQIRGSLDRPERYAAALGSTTAVLHLAARTGRASPAEYTRDNVEGTRALLEAIESEGTAGFVNVSSIAVKFPEAAYYPYADSKRVAEGLVNALGRPWVTVRPTMVLGQESPIWKKFRQIAGGVVAVLPGSPETRIQPVHVDDLAEVLLDIASNGVFERRACDLGGADVITIGAFLCRVQRRLTGRGGIRIPVPVGFGLPLLRAFERVSSLPLPLTEGQLSTFLYDGVVDPNPLQERYADRLRGVEAILEALAPRG